ncbi:hypothetical protein JCGZ_17093 [Jatropha curcas]|uniref:Uncharacterized protein n=1 Tax=Jatropha curcas TaxID=180498 RepID=A0A067KES8_JATCU|nr:hypothetical protein JCGZ_17093 [Jatropha curcas]
MHTLVEKFEHEIVEANESRVGEAKSKSENIRIADCPSDISKGKLLAIVFKYDVAPKYKLARPELDMRINTLLDDKPIMLYEESFCSGVRFPLSEPLRSFFNEYEITINQLHPNGLRLLCGIVELGRRNRTTLTARRMGELYCFYHRVNEDHCFLQVKNDCNIFYKAVKISSLKNWKQKYFIVHRAGGFSIPNQWSSDPMRRLPTSPTLEDQKCVDLIKARGLRSVNLKQVIAKGYRVLPLAGL